MTFKEICLHAYNTLIEKRKLNRLCKKDDYCEEHHIVPKSLGGSNDPENLVNLKASEHFLAHYILFRIYFRTKNERKMAHALCYMCGSNDNMQRLISPEQYELARRTLSAALSAAQKGIPKSEEAKQKMRKPKSEEHRKNLSISHKGQTPWNKGMKGMNCMYWFNNGIEETTALECPCGFVPGRLLSFSEESKKKDSDAQKGRKWFNNGIEEKHEFECPEGFVPGRLKKNSDSHKGRKWFNNGVEEIQVFECPNGWTQGRLAFSEAKKQNMSAVKKGIPTWNKGMKGIHWFNNGVVQTQAFECPCGFVRGMLKKSATNP